MNKQQLANKIWESANKLRSKIEANDYKDYILGFIFYKYLSDKELRFLKDEGFCNEDIKSLNEENVEAMDHVRKNIGYFISYENLFSTWVDNKSFDVSNVRDALSAFSRLIEVNHKKIFEGIFTTLETGLSKLGDTTGKQTKAISNLIDLIKDIPMNGKQGYDVLGFIYEYLISMFAANAGKKAGEFYTPHEVSLLMSEIMAHHLKDRPEIKIYDPTSGSGSLLINIGHSVAKHMKGKNNIKYYAQELKENTYNLTRMNLIMRGIKPSNIATRNGDTLADDWPYFDESDPTETYDPLFVDAVVSNPPYSQHWEPEHKKSDPRYAKFGLAPKSKADYAFLLHDLYHLKTDGGIMTIVLPHGVLFRGGEEGKIREKLIEGNHIDAIIGLPANIFFGTGIPTTVLVLKKKRDNSDTLIVDASNGFIKEGKNNKLQASDIKKVVDSVINRSNIEGYSRKVEREEIRKNDYNLNIPRYVSSYKTESWDIYATMFGGIPNNELAELKKYWEALPNLRETLFSQSGNYSEVMVESLEEAFESHSSVKEFKKSFTSSFASFEEFLDSELIDKMMQLNVAQREAFLSKDIFNRLVGVPLIDKYNAYQILHDQWLGIEIDLEMIQTEGFDTVKRVDPNMVIKKKNGKDTEVQEGWFGRIIPFELAQRIMLKGEFRQLQAKESRLEEITATYSEIIDSLTEEEKDSSILNDANDKFVNKEIPNALKDILADVKTPEEKVLNDYLRLSKKADKVAFISKHSKIEWNKLTASKDGTYAKAVINGYIQSLKENFEFAEDSFESKVVKVQSLIAEEKQLKREIKQEDIELHQKTKAVIESLSEDEMSNLLKEKWVKPLNDALHELPATILSDLISKITALVAKYKTTLVEVASDIRTAESSLSTLLDELVGSDEDMAGLAEFKSLLSVGE